MTKEQAPAYSIASKLQGKFHNYCAYSFFANNYRFCLLNIFFSVRPSMLRWRARVTWNKESAQHASSAFDFGKALNYLDVDSALWFGFIYILHVLGIRKIICYPCS